jgi:hypothetical protein
MSHEFSAVTYGGVRKALQGLGWYDGVLAAASPTTRTTLLAPEAAKFHPGSGLDEIVALVEVQQGLTGPEQLMYAVTARSLSGIAAPLARMFITLMGDSPAVILSRYETFVKSISRGLSASWAADDAKSGTLTIRYPAPLSLAIANGWKGAVSHALDFCKARGTVEVLPLGEGGRAVRLQVRWE